MALEDGLGLELASFEECFKAKMIRKDFEHSLKNKSRNTRGDKNRGQRRLNAER